MDFSRELLCVLIYQQLAAKNVRTMEDITRKRDGVVTDLASLEVEAEVDLEDVRQRMTTE